MRFAAKAESKCSWVTSRCHGEVIAECVYVYERVKASVCELWDLLEQRVDFE